MKFILEYKKFSPKYDVGDIVYIKYWYNRMLTPVKIVEKKGNKFKVTHNIEESKIRKAPDEFLKNSDILAPLRS